MGPGIRRSCRKYDVALGQSKARLVPFFPDRVRVYFTAETFLPVKIVYLKNDLDESGKVSDSGTDDTWNSGT